MENDNPFGLSEEEARLLVKVARKNPKMLHRFSPHEYAAAASDGDWKCWNYLELISRRVLKTLDKPYGNLIIEAPPRHGKSQFLARWLPLWFLDTRPNMRVILVTHTKSLSQEHGRWIRDQFETNPFCVNKLTKGSHAKADFMLKNGSHMYCIGIGGTPTGRGGDLLLIDDPYASWEEAQNPRVRKEVRDWVDGNWLTRREPNARIILLHTRWHQDDLAGTLQENRKDGATEEEKQKQREEWPVISLPAIWTEEEEDPDLGRTQGDALCPERFNTYDLLTHFKPHMSEEQWRAQYQQKPVSNEGAIWKTHWWKFWTKLPTEYSRMIISCDFAFLGKKKSDPVVLQVWMQVGKDRYLVDQVRDRMGFEDSKAALLKLVGKWRGYTCIVIEMKANGPAIEDTLREMVGKIEPVNPSGGKEARALAVAHIISEGHVFLPADRKEHPWVEGFIEEAMNFPTAPDDQVDAASQALIYLRDNPEMTPRERAEQTSRALKTVVDYVSGGTVEVTNKERCLGDGKAKFSGTIAGRLMREGRY